MKFGEFLNDDLVAVLTQTEPWTAYRSLEDIFEKNSEDPEVVAARDAVLSHSFTAGLIERLFCGFRESFSRHDNPDIPPHLLKLLAEIGVRGDDPGMKEMIAQVEEKLDDGLYASRQVLPGKSFKLSAMRADEWHALPCDTPEIASALVQMGHSGSILSGVCSEIAARWSADEHWFCHHFFVEKQFAVHKTACPMAGLMALDLFSRTSFRADESLIEKCVRPIFYHRDLGKSLYYFGRSKRFWTFKFPFVWYNALYMADVLTRFPQFHDTPAVGELIDWILENRAEDGTWKATSVFRRYKDMDFGQKKTTSPWITYLCLRVLKQRYGS